MKQEVELFTRMSVKPDNELLNLYGKKHIMEDSRCFDFQMEVHLAHTIMLAEQRIIKEHEAIKILKSLLFLLNNGISIINFKPEFTDLYSNIEAWLIEQIGLEIGGKIHTGRSRNDLNMTVSRLYTRSTLVDFALDVCKLLEVILKKSSEHIETVMPGFTHHSQHAQPTTLGHFLIWAFDCFYRDLGRVMDCYNRVNMCPMGGAALATTGFNLNRLRMAELLSFRALVEHSIDATASRDFQLESAACLAIYANNVGRLIESFLLWNTREVGMVKLAPQYCSYSTIMPQKRNAVALEMLRYFGVLPVGLLSNMFSTLKAIPPGNGREPGYLDSLYMNIADNIIPSISILKGVIDTLEVNKDRCMELARKGYSTMTELADEIVREKGLSFAAARKIVGRVALIAEMENIPCDLINGSLVNRSAMDVIGEQIQMTDEDVKQALDPLENVLRRKLIGGPAFSETNRMILERYKMLEQTKNEWETISNMLQNQSKTLKRLAREYVD